MNDMVDRQWIAAWWRVRLSDVDSAIVPKLRGYRIGRRTLFKRADVEAYQGEAPDTSGTLGEFMRRYAD